MKQKAAHYIHSGRFEIRDIQPARPGLGEVAIRVAYCGICGTDRHIYHGKMDARVKPPQIIGHEMCGVISELGDGVTGWKPGDYVTVRPLDWCGECPACKAGHSHICMKLKFMGIDSVGAFQNVWIVKARTLCRVPSSVPRQHAALIEPVAVACHDVRIGRVRKGETVVALGGGPIGMLIAMVARAGGAKVILSEINPFRIAAAQAAGFETINPLEQDLVAAVNERTSGAGADVVFEVTASEPAAKIMTDLVRTRGRIVVVGIYSQKPPVDLFRFFWREIELLGARLYESQDFERAVELAASGELPLGPLITGVHDLENIQAAFESMENNQQAMKTLVRCSAEG